MWDITVNSDQVLALKTDLSNSGIFEQDQNNYGSFIYLSASSGAEKYESNQPTYLITNWQQSDRMQVFIFCSILEHLDSNNQCEDNMQNTLYLGYPLNPMNQQQKFYSCESRCADDTNSECIKL